MSGPVPFPALATHRHLQLNIKQTMPHARIVSDVRRAFAPMPDTIVFNEAVAITHDAIRSIAAASGYGVRIDKGPAGQVVLAWRLDKFRAEAHKATLAMPGRKDVTPTRYVKRTRLRTLDTGRRRMLVGTHMVASGWTGTKHLDAWRQRGWYGHAAIMTTLLRAVAMNPWNDVVIWSGDCNRPPYAWTGKRPFPRLTNVAGLATSKIVDTDHTHGGITFDYVGFLSRKAKVRVAHWSTPSFNSDHDGILVDLEWAEPAPAIRR